MKKTQKQFYKEHLVHDRFETPVPTLEIKVTGGFGSIVDIDDNEILADHVDIRWRDYE